MKFLPASLALLGGLLPSSGQEKSASAWDVEIAGPISDGTRAEPAPKPEPIDFKVLTLYTRQIDVTEAAEMSDLPPVKGRINVTVQMVEDPGLPDPPPALRATAPDDPAVIARMEALRKNYRGTELVFLSATVYDDSRTLLRIYPNGKIEGEVSAWTNLNFNHFSGFSTFRVNEADGTFSDRGLLMGIGNFDAYKMRRRLAKYGHDYNLPEVPILPDLADSGPSFVVIGGDTQGQAMETLSQVHDLYRKEGVRMEAAFHAREKAYAERKAYLLAFPPVPEDIVIRFWQREQGGK